MVIWRKAPGVENTLAIFWMGPAQYREAESLLSQVLCLQFPARVFYLLVLLLRFTYFDLFTNGCMLLVSG